MILIKFVIVLILINTLGNVAGLKYDNLSLLKKVCNDLNSNDLIEFEEIEQVQSLIDIYKKNPNLCPEVFKESFLDVEKLLNQQVLNDVTSLKTYNSVRYFYNKYLSYYAPEAKNKEELILKSEQKQLFPISKSLKQFSILFVDKIVGLLKRQLIDRIEKELQENISEEEFKLILTTREESSNLIGKGYSNEPKSLNDLFVLLDNSNSKLLVEGVKSSKLMLVKELCDKRFRPVYEELFVPLIRFVNLGFEETTLRTYKDGLKLSWEYGPWYSVIETCLLFQDVNLKTNSELDRIKIINVNDKQQTIKSNNFDNIKELEFLHRVVDFGSSLWAKSSSDRQKAVKEFEKSVDNLFKKNHFDMQQKIEKMLFESIAQKSAHNVISENPQMLIKILANFFRTHKSRSRTASAFVGLILDNNKNSY